MNKEFIPYEQAFELKELGYDDECTMYYAPGHPEGYYLVDATPLTNSHWMFTANDNKDRHLMCTAPLYQQAFRWFREKYGLDGHVTFRESTTNKIEGINSVYYNIEIYTLMSGDAYKTYNFKEISNKKEEAELACLIFLIEMVKNK